MRFLLLFACLGLIQAQDLSSTADEYVQSWVRDGLFRGTVLVAKDGKPVFQKSYGQANEEWSIPNAL